MTTSTTTSSFSLSRRVGFYSAALNTFGGITYFLVILIAIISGNLTFPPSETLQLFGGISSLIVCPLLVVMMASLHAVTPPFKRVLSQVSLGFTLLFALAVSINRFSQLGVVRQAALTGRTEGISWFLAYGDYSVLLGLEYLGWAWFLGLALLFAAPLFSGGRLDGWIRRLMVLYGALGIVSSIGFLLGNWLSLLGFVAWGVVLYIITALLAVYFGRGE
jgi:hypothetical protein